MIAFIKTVCTFLTAYKSKAVPPLIVAACLLSAWLGSSYQKAKCEAQIADFKAQIAIQVKRQEKDYADRLSEATSNLVLANRRADDARAERDNLLNRLCVADARESVRANSSPERSYREEYAQCRRLLSESIDLLVEGDELVRGIAVEKDALSEIVK